MKHAITSASRKEWAVGYAFAAPAVILFLVFTIIPLFGTLYFSFTNYDFFSEVKMVGFANYAKIFRDKNLLAATGHTLYFGIFAIFTAVFGGMLLAVFLNRKVNPHINGFFRFAFFLPYVVAAAYCSLIWFEFYSTGTGIFNYYLRKLGLEPIGWLTDKRYAMASIILMDVWKNVGYFMTIFLAGLQNIPNMYYEAAELDGASWVQKYFHITIPLLTPTLFFVLIMTTINALQIFEPIQIMTKGGPVNATRSIVIYIYQNAFQKYNLGYASALSIVLFLAVSGMTLFQFKTSKKWVNYV